MTTGEKLSRLRRENNYTQEQLAERLGVSRQSISKWESDAAYPETDRIIELSRLFGCTADYLLKDEAEEVQSLEQGAEMSDMDGFIRIPLRLRERVRKPFLVCPFGAWERAQRALLPSDFMHGALYR